MTGTIATGPSVLLPVTDASHVGAGRRMAGGVASQAGLGAVDVGKVALVVTELASNLVRHAGGGDLVLRGSDGADGPAVDVLALDRGRGMADVDRCFEDGFSTGGSPGTGLGAVRRAASQFDVYAAPGHGVAMFVRIRAASADHAPRPALALGVVSVAKRGEDACGDAWAMRAEPARTAVTVIDGLGHGVQAAAAAAEAVRTFGAHAHEPPGEILHAAHGALRKTRGAAMAIAALDLTGGTLRFAGTGNVACTILAADGATRSLASHNGTLGHEMRRVQEFEAPWDGESVLVMHSDGLQSRWRLDAYPGLWGRHPALIAGVLFRDFQRGHDDTTVLAVRRWTPPAAGSAAGRE